ncbi:hypothetical protein DRW03_27045 [Corallococcus sp. H22C18031201]|nr:hypothetical protein DRW03_27045 [Corallococcus sp. H22C18031201]
MRPSLLAPLLALLASAAAAAPPTVSAKPARVILGQESEVWLEVRVPEGAGPLRAAASLGSFEQSRLEGGSVRRFRWKPPSQRHPAEAVLVFWREDEPLPEPVLFRLPLWGRLTLDISTASGAEVIVEVGSQRFGPVRADAKGRAQVPVEVPPGVSEARVLATRGTLRTDRLTPLEVPRESSLVVALTPEPLPASEGGWLLVARSDAPALPEALVVSPKGATLDSGERWGEVVRYRVRPSDSVSEVSVRVRRSVKGMPESRAHASVRAFGVSSALAEPSHVRTWRPSVYLLSGAALARGANAGPMLALGATLPVRHGLDAELEVGLRHATLEALDERREDVSSRVLGVPVLASMRVTLLQQEAFSLHGRAGVGVMPFRHRLSSSAFQTELDESKLGAMAFLSAQGAYRLGRFSALVELRGAWAPARTSALNAQLGGAGLAVGMRFTP